MRIQVVWWREWPKLKWWHWPRDGSSYYTLYKKPAFYGLYLGLLELRFWLK